MKRFVSVLLTVVLVACLGTVCASAEEYTGGDWYVHFTAQKKMDSSYDAVNGNQMSDIIKEKLQPGDSATFYMELENQYPASTDWYMTNKVLRSLEQNVEAAQNGGYAYELRYVNTKGEEEVLYTSSRIGGEKNVDQFLEDRKGLKEATSALEDFFYLDTIGQGQKGYITLDVSLDGETQGNAYQDTLAQLQMNFAVELSDDTTTWRPVRTGDETNMLLWAGIMLGCGLAAAGLGVYTLRRNRKNREGDDE